MKEQGELTVSKASREEVEKLLNRGLRQRWYPIAPSWMVQENPLGVTRLSEHLAIWRDESGIPHVIEDRCPHRGARLSLGWNLGDRLACWYHGVEVNHEGEVIRVPAVEKCPMEGKCMVQSYPTHEVQGAIFAYFGDEQQPDAVKLQLPEELTDDAYGSFLSTALWRCNYRYAIDNVMDPMHGAYLHAKSHSMSMGDKSAQMRLSETGQGWMFEKENQRGVNFDWVEFADTGTFWMRLAIPYRKNAGPGGNFTIIGFVTPVTEQVCQVYFWRVRKVSGWERDTWRFLYKNRLEGLHWDVLEQDRVVLEAMQDNARTRESLYQHDAGMTKIRRDLRILAQKQVNTQTSHA